MQSPCCLNLAWRFDSNFFIGSHCAPLLLWAISVTRQHWSGAAMLPNHLSRGSCKCWCLWCWIKHFLIACCHKFQLALFGSPIHGQSNCKFNSLWKLTLRHSGKMCFLSQEQMSDGTIVLVCIWQTLSEWRSFPLHPSLAKACIKNWSNCFFGFRHGTSSYGKNPLLWQMSHVECKKIVAIPENAWHECWETYPRSPSSSLSQAIKSQSSRPVIVLVLFLSCKSMMMCCVFWLVHRARISKPSVSMGACTKAKGYFLGNPKAGKARSNDLWSSSLHCFLDKQVAVSGYWRALVMHTWTKIHASTFVNCFVWILAPHTSIFSARFFDLNNFVAIPSSLCA